MPTLFIANPTANRGRNTALLASLRPRAAGNVEWIETTHARHATEIAKSAHTNGFDVVAAIGGDGTVHEVVNGLMCISPAERPALGVVPMGTGNDFALGSRLFTIDSNVALQRVLNRAAMRTVDCARVTDEHGNTEFWDNTLGIGFDAAANLQARAITRMSGFPMYLLAVVRTIARNFHSTRMRLEVDGATLDRDVLMLTIGNGPREGGGFTTTPASKMDDGVLDFCMVGQLTRPQMFALLPRVMNGTHIDSRHVSMGSLKRLHLRMERPLPVHIDGEIFGLGAAHELDIEVLPAMLRVIV